MTLAVDLGGRTILIAGYHKGGIGGATARQVTLAGGTVILLDKDQATGLDTVIFSEPVELANAIVFLLSDLASGISGQNLTVDRSLSTKFSGGARKSRREMMETQQPR